MYGIKKLKAIDKKKIKKDFIKKYNIDKPNKLIQKKMQID
jgi:hypothetical protein